MIFKGTVQESGLNNALYMYTNPSLEQRAYLCGSFTPNGPVGKGNNARFASGGDIGNGYKVINEMCKFVFMSNMENVEIWYPNLGKAY